MKILLVGSGGREHALAWKLGKSPKVEKIYVAPGNGGTAKENKCENIEITKICDLLKFAKNNNIDLTMQAPSSKRKSRLALTFLVRLKMTSTVQVWLKRYLVQARERV